MNFWILYSLILSLQEAPSGNTIAYFTVSGNQMWIAMSDHSVFGPLTIPTAVWNFRGPWQPGSAYAVNDVFTEGGAVYLCVYPQANSGTSFFAQANDGDGHYNYALLLAAPPSELPTNGLPGQMLQWTTVDSPGGVAWAYIKRNIALYMEEPPNPLEEVLRYTFTESTQFPVNFLGSYGDCGTEATVEQAYEVYQNGANIGTIAFGPSPHVEFFAPAVVTFAAGDTMTILAPTVPDPHLQMIAFTLMGVVVLP